MYEDLSGAKHHSAIVDVTDRCNLRCKHCFYYREDHESQEMDAEAFLAGLRTLQERHAIKSMGWCGGEPLYRREVVEEGVALFRMNQLFTNGTFPIPDIPSLLPFVSLDGTRPIHDEVRGRGSYDRVMDNVASTPANLVIFQATIHRRNAPCLEQMVRELSRLEKPTTKLLILLFTPLKRYESVKGYRHTEIQRSSLDFTWDERDRVIDRVIALRREYADYILNSEVNLELMNSVVVSIGLVTVGFLSCGYCKHRARP